jgi:polysaccharide biosynthesis protein PslH
VKILWVKAGRLLPVDTGGKIRSFNLLRQLALRHQVTVLSYYDGASDESYEQALQHEFPRALALRTDAPTGRMAVVWHYLRHLADRAPYAVTKFASPPVMQFVKEAMRVKAFDVVVCDFLSASLNIPSGLSTPAVLFQHNVEAVLWERQAHHERNVLKRMAFKWEAYRMRHYERSTVSRFHHVIAVSEADRQLMIPMAAAERVSVAPTGVDLSAFRTVAGERASSPLVVFVGSMDWEPNIDGVEYFCREIWPRILAAVPNARFRIVGRNPHLRVRRLVESPAVEVTGSVASIVEHLAQATAVVVPLRVGGGTRLKIYEAMAAGCAVVSTTVGAEGLEVTTGEDILLADMPAEFSKAVVVLLRDEDYRRRIEHGAATTAARFDWPVVVRRFEESLEQAIAVARLADAQQIPVPS